MKNEIQKILDRNFTRGDNKKALKELCVLFDVVGSDLLVSLLNEEEIINSPLRFNVVRITNIKLVFKKFGIICKELF